MQHVLRLPEPGDRPAVLVGTRDPVTARLVLDAGFSGGWVSSLELSAMLGLQDNNLLGVHDVANIVRVISLAVPLPLLVDADNGYGSPAGAARAVREFESSGAAGICLEDSQFPKRNSFDPRPNERLLSIGAFSRRIEAAFKARLNPDFLVVGRTEALRAGLGLPEAILRGRAARDAGADVVLIHSTDASGGEAIDIARAWDRTTPLICVPTAFTHMRPDYLGELGYSAIVYANQALRATIAVTKQLLMELQGTDESRVDQVSVPELLALLDSFPGV